MENRKAPGRELGQLDNLGSHVYEALYWAQELAAQNDDQDLKKQFAPIAKELESKIDAILEEIKAAKGRAQDIGGYYHPDAAKVKAAMRPSATLNKILETVA